MQAPLWPRPRVPPWFDGAEDGGGVVVDDDDDDDEADEADGVGDVDDADDDVLLLFELSLVLVDGCCLGEVVVLGGM